MPTFLKMFVLVLLSSHARITIRLRHDSACERACYSLSLSRGRAGVDARGDVPGPVAADPVARAPRHAALPAARAQPPRAARRARRAPRHHPPRHRA